MRYSVNFDLDVPVEATENQVEAWLRFELGETCELRGDNPLSMLSLEASNVNALRCP